MADVKERISLTFDPVLLARIDTICEARGEPRSAFIERVMRYALDELDVELRRMESPVMQLVSRALASSPELFATLAKIAGGGMSRDEALEQRERLLKNLDVADSRRKAKRVKKDGHQG